uniref:Reverse transcriptase zinc-binding domain-containing protein n=1 Tax=Cannabis sativa TaxID=3483 RepID=A0A803QID1_CANSA
MDGTSWDEEVLQDLFDDREQSLIKQIPVNIDQTTDFVFWCKESTGLYTIKSAYHALQDLKGLTNDVDASVFWKILWSLKLPPKIKNLMWRVGSSCLPTLAQLASKFVPVNTRCPLCDELDETISHVLLTCRAIKQVWERVGIGTSALTAGSSWLYCIIIGPAKNLKRTILAIYKLYTSPKSVSISNQPAELSEPFLSSNSLVSFHQC